MFVSYSYSYTYIYLSLSQNSSSSLSQSISDDIIFVFSGIVVGNDIQNVIRWSGPSPISLSIVQFACWNVRDPISILSWWYEKTYCCS